MNSHRCRRHPSWTVGILLAGLALAAGKAAAQLPQEALESIGYARSQFSAEGGVSPATGQAPDLLSTVAGLRACRYLGWIPQGYERGPTIAFVKSCFDEASGGFAPVLGGKPDVRATALGLIALAELKEAGEPYKGGGVAYLTQHAQSFEDVRLSAAALEALGTEAPARDQWVAAVRKMQNADGTFGKGETLARDTAAGVVTLLRLGAQVAGRERVVGALRAGQRPDGGFGGAEGGSDLTTTYQVMRAFYMLREMPEAARLQAFVTHCRNPDGGYGLRPGEASSVPATYFATIVLHWLRELETGFGDQPQTRRILAPSYDNTFSPYRKPVGWLNAGDTLITRTLDAGGWDEKGVRRAGRGNPLTGPFYIRGAEPGDTLVVELKRIELTKDTGYQGDSIAATAVTPQYFKRQKAESALVNWRLDRVNMLGTPELPGLESLRLPLRPFLGCLGVAPDRWDALNSGTAGTHGGNMDYNRLTAGVTVLFPVFVPGALLYCGDGHAAQGDGEVPGSAIETSMEVELVVRVVKGKQPPGVRAENAEELIAVGVERNLDEAFQLATANMAEWLADEYGLSREAVALFLGTTAAYDIGNVVDPRYTLACRVPKEYLRQLEKPRGGEGAGP